MNHIDEVCSLLGLELFEKFNIIQAYPTHKVNNPYHFTDKGLMDRDGVSDNTHLVDLICGISKAESLGKAAMKPEKIILDACCGSRMFWFNKKNPKTVFMDNRTVHDILSDGRHLDIEPDIMGDFRDIPFPDNSFYMVVFDPPHLLRAGDKSWLAAKYGKLSATWREDLKQGFSECMRVLKPHGSLIFKWNEEQVKLSEILSVIGYEPLFGNKKGRTHWLVFLKESRKDGTYENN